MQTPFVTSVGISDSSKHSSHSVYPIKRRGFNYGHICVNDPPAPQSPDEVTQAWSENKPIYLEKYFLNELAAFTEQIRQSKQMYEQLLSEVEIEDVLDQPPYPDQLAPQFEILSSRFDEADPQEFVSVDFDVVEDGELVLEDIWMRISWLSFHEDDASLRYRFSFGMEGCEDVSLDYERQVAAAKLCEAVFPESGIISANEKLIELLCSTLNTDELKFLERIVYFNAPNGGAQFHHDAEKGHLGVVYAQLTGSTFWFALSKSELITEIRAFISKPENKEAISSLLSDASSTKAFVDDLIYTSKVSEMLDNPAHDEMGVLLNNCKPFFEQLVKNNHGFVLNAGDAILLPQENMKHCAWHSVFCLGEDAGEALSFAIKSVR